LKQRIEALREKENYEDEVRQTFFLHCTLNGHLR